jgi:hypothetical protein
MLMCVSSNMHRFIAAVTFTLSVAACGQATVNLPAGAKAIPVSELGNGPVRYSPDTPILWSLSYQDLIASAAATDPGCQGEIKPPRCTAPYPGTDIPLTAPPRSLYLALAPTPYCYDHQERAGLKDHDLTFVYWIGAYSCRTSVAQPEARFRLVAIPLKLLPSGTVAVRIHYQTQGSDYRPTEPPKVELEIP